MENIPAIRIEYLRKSEKRIYVSADNKLVEKVR